MKHLTVVSHVAMPVTATSSLETKLTGIMEILDRLALAQRQSAWKAPFPIGGVDTTTTTTGTNTGGNLPTV